MATPSASPKRIKISAANLRIRGKIPSRTPNTAAFLGIRYAQPATGALRFASPEPVAFPSETEVDAKDFSPECPQLISGPPSVYRDGAPELTIGHAILRGLCVWAPVKGLRGRIEIEEGDVVEGVPEEKRGLRVIVWITGGGFVVGGSSIAYQNPGPWVESSGRHIVVSVNYRVSIMGFPNAGALPLTARNIGLLDQRCALEWVHANIHLFSGDSTCITHMGQSAGARSIDCHSFAYPTNPLVCGLICKSGTANLSSLDVIDEECKAFNFVPKSLGFKGDRNDGGKEELSFMRGVEWEAIQTFFKRHLGAGNEPPLSFGPIRDGFTLLPDFETLTAKGKFSKLPAIIGTTADEGVSLAAYTPEGPNLEEADSITQGHFLAPANVMTVARSAHTPTFRYLYHHPSPAGTSAFPNISPRPWMRAYHSSELPLIFGTHDLFRGTSTEEEYKLSRAWQELYVLFAEEGAEGLRKAGWADSSGGKGILLGSGEKGWKAVDLGLIESNRVAVKG